MEVFAGWDRQVLQPVLDPRQGAVLRLVQARAAAVSAAASMGMAAATVSAEQRVQTGKSAELILLLRHVAVDRLFQRNARVCDVFVRRGRAAKK
jgi:hypothetical protein